MNTPVITADMVMTVPTDKSIPEVMMTNVTPIARMPFTAVAMRMPTRLLAWKKFGDGHGFTKQAPACGL